MLKQSQVSQPASGNSFRVKEQTPSMQGFEVRAEDLETWLKRAFKALGRGCTFPACPSKLPHALQ
jgi:hypothetical protein